MVKGNESGEIGEVNVPDWLASRLASRSEMRMEKRGAVGRWVEGIGDTDMGIPILDQLVSGSTSRSKVWLAVSTWRGDASPTPAAVEERRFGGNRK